jgi:SAM-dependent methyltransferase
MRAGALGQALPLLEAAIAADPNYVPGLLDLATLYQSAGAIGKAGDCYRQCSALEPDNGYYRELFTQCLTEQWMGAALGRRIGRESAKTYAAKQYSGFFRTYLSGAHVLDIGYRGGFGETEPIVPQAVGVDFGYPGYDGIRLPFESGSQDAVYSSHCLEHMHNAHEAIPEWLRVLRTGGFMVITVPHQYLYERKANLPSKHPGHIRFFTPSTLLALIESSLAPNTYRVRHLADNDLGYVYSLPTSTHPCGCYEIELVLEKIDPPTWSLEP